MGQHLMKGNEAVIHGALLGGATHYFGYPITPASEIAHAAAELFPRCGRHFLQAECEVSSISMLYGAAAAGARAITGTSGPGLSLMAEGLSYLSGSELPCVVVDVQRAGPGLGYIWPEQADYNFVVHGAGHGSHSGIVLAPNSAQEMCDCAYRAFELAERYRCTVFILADAYVGQMMEPVELPREVRHNPRKDWALYGDTGSRGNLITSIYLKMEELEAQNLKLQEKYRQMEQEIVDWEEIETADADYLFVAYGITSRICHSALLELRAKGIRAGMLRPKTLFPFPSLRLKELAGQVEKIIAAEMSSGQMVRDVRLAVAGEAPVELYNWMGGRIPSTDEIVGRLENDIAGKAR
ncbi:MAG: 3-methyl-2-oxobutanoate dehydrogenase subunit VorB [Desulfobulbaceae bacterium]|nr:MAG: 3-methyl-2-oxobutanoate dehydrogenase subunit VorB [Desulfobulbaceae bacterium]